MGCMFLWVKIDNAFAYFVSLLARRCYFSMLISNRVYFDCKTKLCLGRQGKYIFTQESLYLQDILKDINEQDTSFLDC